MSIADSVRTKCTAARQTCFVNCRERHGDGHGPAGGDDVIEYDFFYAY